MSKAAHRENMAEALAAAGYEVLYGKGGWFVRGQGWKSWAWAYKVTGLTRPKRVIRGRVGAWGDYATIAMLNAAGRRRQNA